MSYSGTCGVFSSDRQWGPWTLAGGADPDFPESDRHVHHVLLTDPQLLGCFRRRFRDRGAIGYCCAGCGRTRAEALTASPHVGECEVAVVDDKRNRR